MPGRLQVDVCHLHATSAQWAGRAAELSGAPPPSVTNDWPSGQAVDAIHIDAATAAAALQDRLSTTAAGVGLAANAYATQENNSSDLHKQVR
jgi:hypothetical protein